MRQLRFAGSDWIVKSSFGEPTGPGNNVFSDASDAVWTDPSGRLHLTIRRHHTTWHCTEVVGTTATNFGRHRFRVESSPAFDQNVVAGVFLYRDDRHEIDIELSRFGSLGATDNAQFVVQPVAGNHGGFIQRFSMRHDWRPSIHEISRARDRVEFRTSRVNGDIVAAGVASEALPEGPLTPRINLWLFAGPHGQGEPPSDGREVELVVGSYSHTPHS